MPTHPVETYLKALRRIHASNEAQNETSYYAPLENLLNQVGRDLKPRVTCVMQLKDRGADHPDGGLFTEEQLEEDRGFADLIVERSPARGVMEVKPLAKDVSKLANSSQVKKYWKKYGLVLATNFRAFRLVGRDEQGRMAARDEGFVLADSEAAFWALAERPRAAASTVGDSFLAYLQGALTHDAPITAPQEVAAVLATYARRARKRLEPREATALDTIRGALSQALGLTFEGEKGEHFFRSTLVQTLFYGVFSAFVLWGRQRLASGGTGPFEWELSARYLRVPILRKLFHEISDPGPLEAVGITETLDWAENALNRIVLDTFFASFQESEAIQYFYEPFLEAFDPELRKELGVWYTPREIVRYQVARVDTALREELGVEDGLADPDVYILDPCCGTGAYLVEVLGRIAETLSAKGADALLGVDLKKAAMTRVFGFEILPAPYVVAHLQLGLLLQRYGTAFSETGKERASIYLTNALTGWEPPDGPKQHLLFPELEDERDAAERVKRDDPILVILGNPPYNGFAGVSPAEEEGLLEPYKQGLKDWGITKNYLDDLYVRFYRVAELRIAEKTGRGIVSFISNYSWLSEPSFVVMRQRFLEEFDAIWVDNMNGDSRETGKQTPDGRPDPSVFSTPHNREGIRVGTAITLMVRCADRAPVPALRSRQFWGANKRTELLESLQSTPFGASYLPLAPVPSNRFLLRPWNVDAAYDSWPSVTELCAVKPMLGLNDNRAQATHDISRAEIEQRMAAYYNPHVPFAHLGKYHRGLVSEAAGFKAAETRRRLLDLSEFRAAHIWPFWFKPFDRRWAYIERNANLWNRVRPDLLEQRWSGNEFLLARANAPKAPDGAAFYWSHDIADQHVLHKDAYFIPVRLHQGATSPTVQGDSRQGDLLADAVVQSSTVANLSTPARTYLGSLGIADPDTNPEDGALIWRHTLALGYSPAYLSENASGVRHGWAKVPLPTDEKALRASAELGREIAALLDPDHDATGVTKAPWRPFLKIVGVITRVDGGALQGEHEFGLARWGHTGRNGIVMPGRGRLEARAYSEGELAALALEAVALGLTPERVLGLLGEETYDIYLNDLAYWRNVPSQVWEYAIGGFPVIKKWLSYRDEAILGRPLTADEVRDVERMARRITALTLLEPRLDANYHAVAGAAYAWPRVGGDCGAGDDVSAAVAGEDTMVAAE